MSEKEKQNLTENDCVSDEEQIENLETETATTENTVQVSQDSSKNTDHNLQLPITEGTEVHPNDVIIVEQLSHQPLEKDSNESFESKVIYEFPIEDDASFSEKEECKVTYEFLHADESQKVSHLPATCVVRPHRTLHVCDHTEYRPPTKIAKKRKDKLVKILNEESPDDTNTAGTSGESERKRKKGSVSSLQNKKHKETENSNTSVTHSVSEDIRQDESAGSSSDEFADIEDNVKDSSSSDNNDSSSTTETAKQMTMKNLDAGIPQRNEKKKESLDEKKSKKVIDEASSSGSNSSPNNKYLDEAAKESLFPSSLKGETIPPIKLSDDMKKSFEMSMPTILEARESESEEQILRPKKSSSNPLIMKTSMVKRKDRCNVCNARLGLCAIRCRCGGYYCAKHRYDKEHNCTFDYKSMGAAEIEKNNPKVVAEKVRKL